MFLPSRPHSFLAVIPSQFLFTLKSLRPSHILEIGERASKALRGSYPCAEFGERGGVDAVGWCPTSC